MNRKDVKQICVYCGSTIGSDPIYAITAKLLGEALAAEGIHLIYGGGTTGLMGVLATSLRSNGGYVTSIMPSSLVSIENAFYDANKYIEVDNFHERKMLMSRMAHAFIVLSGGPGTLEELIEQLAWFKLGIHKKPIFIVNTNGFWNPFLLLLERVQLLAVEADHRSRFILVDEPSEAVKLAIKIL